MHKLLTEKEISKEFGFKLGTLRGWRFRGCGPIFYKIGRRCYYLEEDILAFIKSSSRRSTSDSGPGNSP
jgi:hypothetical protein